MGGGGEVYVKISTRDKRSLCKVVKYIKIQFIIATIRQCKKRTYTYNQGKIIINNSIIVISLHLCCSVSKTTDVYHMIVVSIFLFCNLQTRNSRFVMLIIVYYFPEAFCFQSLKNTKHHPPHTKIVEGVYYIIIYKDVKINDVQTTNDSHYYASIVVLSLKRQQFHHLLQSRINVINGPGLSNIWGS